MESSLIALGGMDEGALRFHHDPGAKNRTSHSEKGESPGKTVDNPVPCSREEGEKLLEELKKTRFKGKDPSP